MNEPGAPPTPAERALLTEAEKLRMQYRNMPTAFSGMIVICTVMCIVLEPGTGSTKVVVWGGLVYLWAITRFLQWRAFRRANPGPHEMDRWRVYSITGSAVAGLIWGIGAVALYVPGGLSYQMFLVMGLVGIGAGCVYA